MEAVGQGKKLFSFKQLYLAPDNYNEKVVRNSCTERPTVRTETVLVS